MDFKVDAFLVLSLVYICWNLSKFREQCNYIFPTKFTTRVTRWHHHTTTANQRRFSHSKVSALSFSRPSANIQRVAAQEEVCVVLRVFVLIFAKLLAFANFFTSFLCVFPVCPDPDFVGFLVIGVIRRGFSCKFGDQWWSFSFSKTLVCVVIVWEGKLQAKISWDRSGDQPERDKTRESGLFKLGPQMVRKGRKINKLKQKRSHSKISSRLSDWILLLLVSLSCILPEGTAPSLL